MVPPSLSALLPSFLRSASGTRSGSAGSAGSLVVGFGIVSSMLPEAACVSGALGSALGLDCCWGGPPMPPPNCANASAEPSREQATATTAGRREPFNELLRRQEPAVSRRRPRY